MNKKEFSLTLSSLSALDIANISLQQTSIPPQEAVPALRAWLHEGKLAPLLAFYEDNKSYTVPVLQKWAQNVINQYLEIRKHLPDNKKINSVMDIGCGYGLIDLFLYKEYQCDLYLVDIEMNNAKHYGFQNASMSGYSSNATTFDFLVENDIPKHKIHMINPRINEMPDVKFDLIWSSFSMGFHYSISTYENYILAHLTNGANVIFDKRLDMFSHEEFGQHFETEIIVQEGRASNRILFNNFCGK